MLLLQASRPAIFLCHLGRRPSAWPDCSQPRRASWTATSVRAKTRHGITTVGARLWWKRAPVWPDCSSREAAGQPPVWGRNPRPATVRLDRLWKRPPVWPDCSSREAAGQPPVWGRNPGPIPLFGRICLSSQTSQQRTSLPTSPSTFLT